MSIVTILKTRFQEFLQTTNKDRLINTGLPIVANVSYVLHSSKFLAPQLFSKVCGDNSIAISRTLFINSIFGNILYVFSLKHLKSAQIQYALGYSAFASVMFNLGSILFWSLSRVYLPQNDFFLTAYGFLASLAILKLTKSYLDFIDNSINNS